MSSLGVVLFINIVWLQSVGWSSADTQLRHDMISMEFNLVLLYFAGIVISAFSPLGSLVQLPSLVVLLPLTWYLDYADSAAGYGVYALAFSASLILILSMFIGIEYPGRKLSIPPKSRMRWWCIHEGRLTSKPFSKSARTAIVSVVAASVIILASFTFYVRSNDVSRLNVGVIVNGKDYGSVNFTVYLDGEAMHSGTLVYDGGHYAMYAYLSLELSSGSHTLELDAWNDSAVLSIGVIDSVAYARTLPFTKEQAYLLLGVFLI